MKIYKLRFDGTNYKNLYPCEDKDADFYRMFDGTSYIETWEKLDLTYLDEEEGLKEGNYTYLFMPIVDKAALNILQALIGEDAELLPMMRGNEEVYGINVLTLLDALDYEKSECVKFSDGKIMAIRRYAFIENEVQGRHIFKLSDESHGAPFVSEYFKKIVEENGLTGFKFELVWDD
ncbi:imm11 family protein [Butyrivibrio sp. VCB2006]|uniref:imm11 family protein n=1 Tax=Butyrivibrio sp. VCB2006 TaxID=1280679 RepID=UPI0004928CD5|nr:DUF1629 domain-containing protein [Butyrivibrio sp. VCB2006]